MNLESGIKSTRALGKYLGLPVLQKRINKDTFGDILEKVSSRLAGWKRRCLSFAGRLTLTKGVLSTIPIHTMSIISLPKSIIGKLDKVSRSFLWGSSTEQRKQHLLSWQKVCRPKEDGGLGIRMTADMNRALLGKVGWRLLHDTESLWAKVLRSKYKVTDTYDPRWIVTKGTWSSTWRSIAIGLRDVVIPGVSWVLGDGKMVRFWQDIWLLDKPLRETVMLALPVGVENLRVCDYWRYGSGWLVDQIIPFVTTETALMLRALVVDDVTGSKDRLSWGQSSDGQFSVSSAYSFLTNDTTPRQNLGALFRRVWSVVAPERVRVFLWLSVHQVLMTNVERQRRHLSESGMCQVCKGANETIIHILRDCPAMEGVWLRLVPVRKRQEFFAKSLLEWLYSNLGNTRDSDGTTWAAQFVMALWWSWKWRCINVFNGTGRCRDRVKFVREQAKEVTLAHATQATRASGMISRAERRTVWMRPQTNWVKVNTDGASRGNPGLATAGGVLRDERGHWRCGFALNIGICSAPLAELWGVYYGLWIAWEQRAQRVELEVDSEVVVRFLTTRIGEENPLSFLVRLCHGFISRDWIVRISHVHREANRLADGLANYAFSLSYGFTAFDSVPDVVNPLLLEDLAGVSGPGLTEL
ncbi:unnamed protein product [Microthlaspi erraticum]|uniref:RNase H type-1 domain-containing protein n=1 Tax=Microthlaspi erraticum TaxID=1685480 RepID=A0A6D2J0S4_9BRAS|nr:unnamed protein product [Microthlaspi erraticum]